MTLFGAVVDKVVQFFLPTRSGVCGVSWGRRGNTAILLRIWMDHPGGIDPGLINSFLVIPGFQRRFLRFSNGFGCFQRGF